MEIKERDVREVASEDMAKTLLESLILFLGKAHKMEAHRFDRDVVDLPESKQIGHAQTPQLGHDA